MKTAIYFLGLFLGLTLFSCGDSATDGELSEEDYTSFQGLNLSPYEIPAIIMIPDETANIGASTKPEVVHIETGFKWDIEVGPNFQMVIEDYGNDRTRIKEMKRHLTDKKKFFKINYIIDEPDLIMYEKLLVADGKSNADKAVGVEHKTYHVLGQKIIDNISYEFKSRDDGYEKVIIDLMVKSIRSIKPTGKK